MEGNQMKMREALDAINSINTGGLKRLLVELVEADIFDGGLINKTISAVEKARRALSVPRRNCDVGTANEQAERMDYYCACHGERIDGGWRCEKCPLCSIDRCEIAWAQMLYEADRKGKK